MTINIQEKLGGLFKFTQTSQIGGLVSNLVGIMIAFASLMLLFYFVWSGLRWMSAGGDKAAITEARSRLNNALMGFLIVLASWAIYALIRYMLGLGSGTPAGSSPAGPGKSPDYVDCCPLVSTSEKCCDYMQKFGDYYVLNRYQNDPVNCDQTYVNWGLWQQDWDKNVGHGNEDQDECAP